MFDDPVTDAPATSREVRKKLFAAFIGREMLEEWGRLPYAVLRPFTSAGYEVLVYDDLRRRLIDFHHCEESELPEPARLTLAMSGVKFTNRIPDDSREFIYLFDRPLDAAMHRPWLRQVQLRFDTFSSHWLTRPLIAPYSMHPAQSELVSSEWLQRLRLQPRDMRAFFAGDSKGYSRRWVRYPAPKLPRLEVVNVLKARLGNDLVTVSGGDELAQVRDQGFLDKFVLSDSGTGIAPAQWLPTLARADFFLCPPGIVMPMCHNVIEAMAVGTIPLISYAEWFHPNLKHMHDCVTFSDADDLIDKMRRLLAMPATQVADMRARVIEYYERHLKPEVLVETLEARREPAVTMLMHTELNMARNSKKLTRRSFLMRGPRTPGPLAWLGGLLRQAR